MENYRSKFIQTKRKINDPKIKRKSDPEEYTEKAKKSSERGQI